MIRRLALCILIASPNLSLAVDKNILELQRDVALLQDQVKNLQQSQDKQLAAIQTLVQASLDAANRADRDVAVIQSNFQQNGNQLKDQVVGPVVGLSTRMDQVSGDVRTLQQAVADLTSAMSKMSGQLSDINNMIKVLSAPPAAPPPATVPAAGQNGAPGGAAAANMPPMSQTDLFNAANGDYNSGKLEIAMQEFQDFLKYYGNADMAPNAQYWIGQIYYSQKNYDAASQAFDLVVEKYPENPKTRDALFYKGMSLVAMSKRTQANGVFQGLIKQYPGTDTATRACTEVKTIGFNCPKPAPAATAHRKK
jgi:tol-pal system protein YbgF